MATSLSRKAIDVIPEIAGFLRSLADDATRRIVKDGLHVAAFVLEDAAEQQHDTPDTIDKATADIAAALMAAPPFRTLTDGMSQEDRQDYAEALARYV